MIKRGCRFVDRTGEVFNTKQGYKVQLLEYISQRDCTVKFLTEEEVIFKNVYFKAIRIGTIRNPYHPTLFGKGFMGSGEFRSKDINGRLSKAYNTWSSLLERCYCKKLHKRVPTYKNVTVCEEWHNFQNFAEWFYENFNKDYMQNWALDKDILIKDNKIYSPETCCFLPQEINSIFKNNITYRGKCPIGVHEQKGRFKAALNKKEKIQYIGAFSTKEEAFQAYKTAKEDYIKEIADEWKELIGIKVYQAMYNWTTEITD